MDTPSPTDPPSPDPQNDPAAPEVPPLPATPDGARYRFGSPITLISLVVLALVVGFIIFNTVVGNKQQAEAKAVAESASDVRVEMQLKLVVALSKLQPALMAQELDNLEEAAKSPADKRAVAALLYYLDPKNNQTKALATLNKIEKPLPVDGIMRQAMAGDTTVLSAEQKATLMDELGWAGKLLAATQEEALNEEVSQEATRIGIILSLGTLVLIGLMLLGGALFIIATVLKLKGKLPFRMNRESSYGPVFLEAFVVYLATMVVASLVLQIILALGMPAPTPAPAGGDEVVTTAVADSPDEEAAASSSGIGAMFMIGQLLVVACSLFAGISWPILRGVPTFAVRSQMGLHKGEGVLREAFFGIVGYIALLPVMALGAITTFTLQQLTADPEGAPEEITHPIMDQMNEITLPGLLMILSLAAVLVPITEETMFRGALYRSMRSRVGIVLALLIVAFVFAVIHPQGLLAVPALMGMAVAFGLLREWRDSLIGPIVAHGLHNGTILVMVTLLAGS